MKRTYTALLAAAALAAGCIAATDKGDGPKADAPNPDRPEAAKGNTQFAPALYANLRGEDGTNHGISDAMSPWSAAVAEPGKTA